MPCSVQHDAEIHIVEIRFNGQLMPQELQTALEQSLASGQDHNTYRYLADGSELQGGHSIVDLYNRVDMLAALRLPSILS